MTEIAPDICSGRISGFLELFASANTQANTCAYLYGLTIIIPRLNVVINPYKLALLLAASRDEPFLVKSIQAYSKHCRSTLKSIAYTRLTAVVLPISAPNNPGTLAIANFFTSIQNNTRFVLGSGK